ncbi:MAG TPA: DeoR family transcriptional regulator [Streptomyces sp.]|nr:DeoR family transcriptional regulator [Streptomyces sp.]
MTGTAAYERGTEIIRLLDVESRVSVSDPGSRCAISPVTTRKDLETPKRRRLLRRVRGGAVRTACSDEGAGHGVTAR